MEASYIQYDKTIEVFLQWAFHAIAWQAPFLSISPCNPQKVFVEPPKQKGITIELIIFDY